MREDPKSRSLPPLTIQRNIVGDGYVGTVREEPPMWSGNLPTHYAMTGATPEEIVAQWQDRYKPRPLALMLDDWERRELLALLKGELTVRTHMLPTAVESLAALRWIKERLEALK